MAPDATEIAHRISSGEMSAREAVDAAITRIDKLNPTLDFMAEKLYEEGRARAGGALSGPLAGVPTLIKDLTDLKGAHTRFGSRAFANNVATSQSPFVDALLAAGLVPLGKSTTPEFGFTATTEPLLTGATHNPWNVDRSSGGSSGGAAAAVASGAVPIAHGSDGGGSIRIPASCCGLVGLKVSRGRCLDAGEKPMPLALSVPGCLSRSVRDTALWLSLTEQNAVGAPFTPVGFVSRPSHARLRVAVRSENWQGVEPEPAVRAAVEETANLCLNLGHSLVQIDTNIAGEAFSPSFTLLWAYGADMVARGIAAAAPGVKLEDVLEPFTLGLVELYRSAGPDALNNALAQLQLTTQRYSQLFESCDVLLTPVLSSPAVPLGFLSPTLPFETLAARLNAYVGYTPLINAVGAPAISLPVSVSPDGLPIGVQFAAPVGGETRLLELAYQVEETKRWGLRKPAVWSD